MTLVVNFFGGPGSGKSSLTGGLFYNLKTHHQVNCEMAREVAKQKVWSGQLKSLEDQDYITALQRQEIAVLVGQVDVVICDSPLLLGCIYAPSNYPQCFQDFTRWTWDQYNNLNFFVERTKPFDPAGRKHGEQESAAIGASILQLLQDYAVPYHVIQSDSVGTATEIVLEHLANQTTDLQDISVK